MFNSKDTIIEDLQRDAAEVLQLLRVRPSRRPVIIEFSGSPKSGKTTAQEALSLFFRNSRYTVETFTERASIAPIPNRKGQLDFNIWVSCASLQGLIEAQGKAIDLFFIDRGIFDGLVWNRLLCGTGRISAIEASTIEQFFLMDRWTQLIDLVCVMKCNPAVSIDRDHANDLRSRRGRIMDVNVLERLNQALSETMVHCSRKFKRVAVIDTSHIDVHQTGMMAARETLSALRFAVEEKRETGA